MKLIFDCRYIRMDHHDGISRFSAELFKALATRVPLIALIHSKEQLALLPEKTEYIIGNDPTNPIAEVLLPLKLNKAGATHVFSPMQTMGSMGRKYKLVLTLHDLIYYKHPVAPSFLPLHVRVAWRLYHLSYWPVRLLLNRADSVVTVSKTSRAHILNKRLTTKDVHVIYNAPETTAVAIRTTDTSSPENRRRLVYMGSFMPYKNVECLVAGMRLLPEFELVLLSKISEQRRVQLTELAGVSASRIIFRNGVSDAEYAQELSNAFALVSASKDEGFGIPLVEAMRQGCPIVVSDIEIFREVAANAASYFDPASSKDFAERVRGLQSLEAWRTASSRSIARHSAFSWNASAEELLAVLEAL